ncbi:MAG: tryptophan-rich sensory protein [Candidatus Abyssobacteria bacterium SURF_5]|uniref:Tryptophan-rich sensory protein n=1 Tax=Abyssobacteria bacterium (strain SURF_5) TaxID=2093360 RepID=A0A3A4P2I6_ABYX5|nr:MAG: tryptophan-rich sensory protein [Candidatus Abyssubacteria bacterium SURF_5]
MTNRQLKTYLSRRKQIGGLIGWLLLCFAVAWIGSLAEPGQWYAELRKPKFNPPDWVFPVVWTILYALMAIAAWLVWRRTGFRGKRIPLVLFFTQLALNGLWPWLFFGFQATGWALLEIVILWAFLLLTLVSFWIENPTAGVLLSPYLAWVSYAALLNFVLWRINA